MQLTELFRADTSYFDLELTSKTEVIDFLAQKLLVANVINDINAFKTAIWNRENQGATGMGEGIAIPHAISNRVVRPMIGFIRLKNPINWESADDQPVNLIFMIATNDSAGNDHLLAISQLSQVLINSEQKAQITSAANFGQFLLAFNVKPTQPEVKNNPDQTYDVIGVTACPTGIAHTYLAQEKMIAAAQSLGMSVKVETQGRRGNENVLTQSDIDHAKVIILAHDKALTGMHRFNGKKVIDTSTKDIIFNGTKVIENYQNDIKTTTIKIKNSTSDEQNDFSFKQFKDFKGNLLGGISRALPFVVAGGILLGIGFLIDFIAGNGNAGGNFGTVNYVAGWFSAVGKTTMMMLVPVLGAYLCYSIVGPQGLMPGFVAGLLADGTGGFVYTANPNGWSGLWSRIFKIDLPMQSGFIGAIVGGYLAAIIVFGLTKAMRNFYKSFHGVRDIVFIPILSLLGIAVTMFAINIPLGYAMYGLQEGLKYLASHNLLILLDLIIGFMMCVDMGGPINKIAYVLGTLSVSGGIGDDPNLRTIMAASMAAGMIPPLGIALSTVTFKKVWSQADRDAAKANWLLGAFFITEGAIPFMVKDPKRISVSALIGGSVTGLLVGACKITLFAPHGGVCVFPLLNSELTNNVGLNKGLGIALYLGAIIIGVVTMSLILSFWKLQACKQPIAQKAQQPKNQAKVELVK